MEDMHGARPGFGGSDFGNPTRAGFWRGPWPDPPGDPPGPPWRGPPPPRFRGRGGPPGPPWNGPPGPRGPWRGPPPPPFFRGPRPPFRGPPPFDPNWDPHPGMMGPGGPMEPHPPGPPGMGGPGMGPPPGHWSDPMSPPSGPPPFSGPRPSHHSAPPPQIADLEVPPAARLAAAAVAAGEINPTELLEVESEPLEVESEPLEVKSEPLEVKSEPLEVNSEPLEVTPEPVEVKSEPLEVEEVEEPAPAKQEDESRPVSSTPVPGSPWCVVWTGDGRVFFYNPSTRTSVWERPEELNGRTDVDKMLQPPKQEPAESKDDEPPAKKVKVEETKKEVKEEAPEEIDLGKEAAIEARSEIPMKQSRDKLNEKEFNMAPAVSKRRRRKIQARRWAAGRVVTVKVLMVGDEKFSDFRVGPHLDVINRKIRRTSLKTEFINFEHTPPVLSYYGESCTNALVTADILGRVGLLCGKDRTQLFLLFFSMGGNGVFSRTGRKSDEETQTELDAHENLLRELLAQNSNLCALVFGVFPRPALREHFSFLRRVNYCMRRRVAAVAKASGRRVTFEEVGRTLRSNPDLFSSDGVHLTSPGTRTILARMAQYFVSIASLRFAPRSVHCVTQGENEESQ
ncbi:pollen-specific leucine-rich repeat extensin-like protein 2 [Amphibalanus amphitrite]|uniref:pollen-specific leucine-rich repeat extensin-like protein 2 n=1 Tax=Amphibalanus amphitrite TaxID=1232801 RepID=UPI001C910FA9|nr:pollen-specific leucine-rich repeat extensin-like protein 2 [Amphibalanus amphitrite]